MIRNFSLTLESIVKSTIAIQQKPLDCLATVVFDNRIALVHLLAEQGGIRAMATTTCYTWINISEKVETQLHKITEQTTWLKKMSSLECLGSSIG